MRILFNALLLTIVAASVAFGQFPYEIIFGDREGSNIYVNLDSDIRIGVWAVANSDVEFLSLPLATNDSIIVSRDGGIFHYPLSDGVRYGHQQGAGAGSSLKVRHL